MHTVLKDIFYYERLPISKCFHKGKNVFFCPNLYPIVHVEMIFLLHRHLELHIDKKPCESHLQSVTIVTALL